MHRLLLDENISVFVSATLQEEGWDAAHVRDRGLLGAADHTVLNKAFEEDRVLITANVGDFRKLAAARELHAGIVLLEDGFLRRIDQLRVVRSVLRILEPDMTNKVAFVGKDGRTRVTDVPD